MANEPVGVNTVIEGITHIVVSGKFLVVSKAGVEASVFNAAAATVYVDSDIPDKVILTSVNRDRYAVIDFNEVVTPSATSAIDLATKIIGLMNEASSVVGLDFNMSVAAGLVPGISQHSVLGTNSNASNAYEDLTEIGGIMTFATSSESLEVVSDDSQDTATGDGAKSVIVITLDSSYEEQIEPVFLDGTTPVALSGTHLRTQRMFVQTAGVTGSNIGDVTLQVSGGGTPRAIIKPEDGTAFHGMYTVPAGKTAFTTSFNLFAPKSESVTFRIRARDNKVPDGAWKTIGASIVFQEAQNVPITAPFPMTEKTDIVLQAKSLNPAIVTAFQEFKILDNT